MPSTRAAMRLLSPRLGVLRQKPSSVIFSLSQLRCASTRYSNPARRASFTTAEVPQAPTFVSSPLQSEQISDRSNEATSRPINPLDARALFLAERERRRKIYGEMRFLGMGLLVSIAGTILTIWNIDLDELEKAAEAKREKDQTASEAKGLQLDASNDVNQQFQGKEVHVIGLGEGKKIIAQGQGQEIELVETGTSSVPHFPRTIYLPTSSTSAPQTDSQSTITSTAKPNTSSNPGNAENQEEYTLVGLGIRSVSFLSIQVYVLGLYVRTTDISALQGKLIHFINKDASTLIPAEKERLRETLLDPMSSREIWTEVLRVPGIKSAWRIVPTRNTDFGHLRDGWMTGINHRTREARQAVKGAETEYDAEDFGRAVGDFKGLFSGGKAPKGSVMILARGTQGDLNVWFQAKPKAAGSDLAMQRLGSVLDERVGRLIWLGYLGGEKVSSEAARRGVAEGCVGFAARPIGSVETMVT